MHPMVLCWAQTNLQGYLYIPNGNVKKDHRSSKALSSKWSDPNQERSRLVKFHSSVKCDYSPCLNFKLIGFFCLKYSFHGLIFICKPTHALKLLMINL